MKAVKAAMIVWSLVVGLFVQGFCDEGFDFKQVGDEYAKKGQIDNAVPAYQEFVDKNPSDTAVPRVAQALGQYFYNNRQYKETVKYLSMIKDQTRMTIPFKIMLARSQYSIGKHEAAIALLEPLAILTTLKVNVRREIMQTLGDANLKLGKDDKALEWYARYQKLGKVLSPDVAYHIAFLQEKKDPAKAKKQYQANIKKFRGDYRNFLRLGVLLSKDRATLTQARSLLKKSIEMADTVPIAWLEAARVYGKLKDIEGEYAAYEQYLKFDENNIEAKTRLGAILLEKGYTEEGERLLEEAIKKAPKNATARVALADAYLKTGKKKEAIGMLEKAKSSKPRDPTIRRGLFEAYYSTNDYKKALGEIKVLLEMQRDNELLLAYAKLLLKLKKLDEAANAIEDIRATDPTDIEALMTLGMVLRAQKKHDEALDIYKEIGAIDLKYAPATFERAEVYLEQNKMKWAEQFYKRALEQDPNMALAELGLARVALQYKNRDGYLEHLDRAEAMDPNNPRIKAERKRSRNMK
ncbi:MAG: tetratricopeptide repeat protein [Chitinispirillaceae bacterium]|nr:tetratricopeptide repeat protein [Chitinispirillaceae bacterium]